MIWLKVCIVIDKDHWLLGLGYKTPIGIKEEYRGKSVSVLLDDHGGWNELVIKEAFHPSEVEAILNIPRLNNKSVDEIIWAPKQKGNFSVKSAYILASNLAFKEEASGSKGVHLESLWKVLSLIAKNFEMVFVEIELELELELEKFDSIPSLIFVYLM